MQTVTRCAKKARRLLLGGVRSFSDDKARKHRQTRHAVKQNLHDGGDGYVEVRPLTGWDVA